MLTQPYDCIYFGRCGGCSWGLKALHEQHEDKLNGVRGLFKDVQLVHSPAARVRDRADLIWSERDGQMHLGLYDSNRQVVDLEQCMMMSEALENFLKVFRLKAPPIRLGSVRLRVSPAGERGVWLDFANQDVKTLFEEQEYLKWLSAIAFVEIGQRRKALVWKDGAPKLTDPVLKPWFESYDDKGEAIPLYGPVGGFSQTGFVANRALIESVGRAVAGTNTKSWLELFCGNGNFTLALASRGYQVTAIEMDELALKGLELSLLPEWREAVSVLRSDVYLKTRSLPRLSGGGLLVDPPRAGLRELLAEFESGQPLPEVLIYVSCFTDVFVKDAARLKALGFELTSLEGVDQFPHSPHAEWVGVFLQKQK